MYPPSLALINHYFLPNSLFFILMRKNVVSNFLVFLQEISLYCVFRNLAECSKFGKSTLKRFYFFSKILLCHSMKISYFVINFPYWNIRKNLWKSVRCIHSGVFQHINYQFLRSRSRKNETSDNFKIRFIPEPFFLSFTNIYSFLRSLETGVSVLP